MMILKNLMKQIVEHLILFIKGDIVIVNIIDQEAMNLIMHLNKILIIHIRRLKNQQLLWI